MSIILAMFVMAVIGCAAWALVTYVPMPKPAQIAITVFAVICIILYGLHAMGIGIPNPSVPQIH